MEDGIGNLPTDSQLREQLERFVTDVDDLASLEDSLSQFNLFEAIGVTRQEVRHSDFLGWLMDPRQTHGVGDLFLRRFLQRAVFEAGITLNVSPVDFDTWDLSDATVKRETTAENDNRRIDILIESKKHSFLAIIENKIGSGEGAGQLAHYKARFGHVRKLLPIFLTVDGDEPSDNGYVSISYHDVTDLLEKLQKRRGNAISGEVRIAIAHYVQMLRRHFVPDSELEKLAQKIYATHKSALDYIFEKKPDFRQQLKELIDDHIKHHPMLELVGPLTKTETFFIDKTWDGIPELKKGKDSRVAPRILVFEILNLERKVQLALRISRGPSESRNRILEALIKSKAVIVKKKDLPGPTTRLGSITLKQYDETEEPKECFDQIKPELDKQLLELSKITAVLRRELS